MKLLIVIFLFMCCCFPQNRLPKTDLIQDATLVNISEQGADIFRIDYFDGQTKVLNMNTHNSKKAAKNEVPTTEFYVWEIDTNLYRDKYHYWQEMPLSMASNYQLTIGDMNNNGFPEIYGYKKEYTDPLGPPIEIYEMDTSQLFSYRATYPDSIKIAKAIFTISSGKRLLTNTPSGEILVYKSTDSTQLPLEVDFTHHFIGQMDFPTFSDFDKNNKTDMIFYDFSEKRIGIYEFNEDSNNFHEITKITHDRGFFGGFAAGDFNQNGKTDIAYGGIWGEAEVAEATSEHVYEVKWQDTVETYNAYMQLMTNDIDENGKPELWIIGFAFYNDYPRVRLTCFEADEMIGYQEKNRIDIVGIFPWFAANEIAMDVDKDSKDEIVMCLGNYIFMLKWVAGTYELFYAQRNTFGDYFGATLYDLDNDNYEELLIHGTAPNQTGREKHFTRIYKPNFISSITQHDNTNNLREGYKLDQNFPNPFNSITEINFLLGKNSFVTVKVYDILSREIATLFSGNLNLGKHKFQWNGRDNSQAELASGVYLIRISAEEYISTIKSILLK